VAALDQIDGPHSSRPEGSDHFPDADFGGSGFGDRELGIAVEEPRGAVVVAEQGENLAREVALRAAGVRDEALAFIGRPIERLMEQLADPPPAPIHELPESSRWSQARASVQSRPTVAAEMPSNAAVSSTESPPKNRSSTIRACRSSSCPRA